MSPAAVVELSYAAFYFSFFENIELGGAVSKLSDINQNPRITNESAGTNGISFVMIRLTASKRKAT
jgi:hypothetical protein